MTTSASPTFTQPAALPSLQAGVLLAERQAQRGRSLAAQGQHAAAAASYETALSLTPATAAAEAAALHVDLAQSLRALGRGDEATVHFERAVALQPQQAHWQLLALLHRGLMLDEQGRTQEAMALFEQATVRFPDAADAWAVLGVVQSHLAEPEAAQRSLARALQLVPGRLEVMERFARTLVDTKSFEDAALVYEQMLRLEPGRPMLASWLLHLKYLMGDWLNIDKLQGQVLAQMVAQMQAQAQAPALTSRPAAEPFGLQGWCADPALLRAAAVAQASSAHPPRPQFLAPPVLGSGPRVRLGYVAGEFREQATAMLLAEVLERHDAGRFEVFAFDTGWDDGSARRRRIDAACEVVPLRGLSDLQAAQSVRERGIDILVNLNGYFGLARSGIFSMRPAPLQVNYLGFPGTIGAPYIDYIVADATVIPPAEQLHYVEQVVHLPHSYQPNDSTRAVALQPARRADAGLPDEGFVFCCLNNAYKILPPVFDVWMRLLRQVPGSVLLLYGDKPELQANLRFEAQTRGVEPQRILFAPPLPNDQHLRRLQLCDLFLDTWPYNAHTTGSDALWAGLPVLTCTGRSFPSRVGASLLQAVGLPELITHDLSSYETLALRLATEPGLLQGHRQRLRAGVRESALYNTPLYARHLEAAYLQMVARARAGLAPEAFAVAALG